RQRKYPCGTRCGSHQLPQFGQKILEKNLKHRLNNGFFKKISIKVKNILFFSKNALAFFESMCYYLNVDPRMREVN
ncbi:MAG: hypothetical protein IJF27_04665, partial [Oscillospiraceae bacterium]|nr:hypothetical protein [Oscillospiraceae bacterium]